MRIPQNVEQWFEVPGDADGARVLVRHMEPGEIGMLRADHLTIEDGVRRFPGFTRALYAALVVQWENVLGPDGDPLELTPRNLVLALESVSGFAQFLDDCADTLARTVRQEREASRGN